MKINYRLPNGTEILVDKHCIVTENEAVKLNNIYYSIASIDNIASGDVIVQNVYLQEFNNTDVSDVLVERMCDNSDYIVIFRYPLDQKELAIDTIRKLSAGVILGLPNTKSVNPSGIDTFLWDLTSVKVS